MTVEYKFWPSKSELSHDFFVDLMRIDLRVEKTTKIASIVSCFAREIKKYLLKNGLGGWIRTGVLLHPRRVV